MTISDTGASNLKRMYVERGEHRLKPDGLHAGPDNWNAQWGRFIKKYDQPTPEQLLKYLSGMMKDVPWLKI